MSNYDVAWDQYSGTTYQAYVQMFDASGTAVESQVTIFNLTGVNALSAADMVLWRHWFTHE